MSVCSDWILAPSGIKLGWSQLLLNTALLSKLEPIRDQLQLLLVIFLFHSQQRSTPWWSMHINIYIYIYKLPFFGPVNKANHLIPMILIYTHCLVVMTGLSKVFFFSSIFLSQEHCNTFTCTCWEIVVLLKLYPSRFCIFYAKHNCVPPLKLLIPTNQIIVDFNPHETRFISKRIMHTCVPTLFQVWSSRNK